MKYYAGIGSRLTPPETLKIMTQIAVNLENKQYTLRSGGAEGADQAFAKGASTKEILTWRDSTPEAEEIASEIHPAWHNCNLNARAQHGRNVMQVLGKDLKHPVEFVICWTLGGSDLGGTRTAIVLARKLGIAVFNLFDPNKITEIIKAF